VTAERFAYIWQYSIDPAYREAFLAAYRPGGDWTRLMSRYEGYVATQLLGDVDDGTRFVTVDYWTSKAARDAFRTEARAEFEALDRRCEAFTVAETFLGDFTVLDAATG